jgi:SAM-dependent methyltransferase
MPSDAFDLTHHNARIFFDGKVADWYSAQGLCAAETTILLRYKEAFAGRKVLDLGAGSGRTTRFLLPLASDYTGVDLSPQMIARARQSFPKARLIEMDIRELSALAPQTFDFVFAPWAVLDALAPQDREKTLAQISARTTPGGLFVFSAHNRDSALAGKPPALSWSKRPVRLALNAGHLAIARANFERMKHLREETAEYALYNDMAHSWQGVFYYISKEAQIAQLARHGFKVSEIYGEDGRLIGPSDDVSADGALHYVAVRA